MSDYIKRKDAIVRLWKQLRRLSDIIPMGKDAAGVAVRIIEDIPSADVVELVRCKDCKYMTEHYDTDGNAPYWTCSEWDAGTDYDSYCSYGERKEK